MSEFINTRAVLGDAETLDALISNTLTELKEDGIVTMCESAMAYNAGIESVDMPNVDLHNVTRAFYSCTNLQTVRLESCTFLGSYTFANCESLTSVYLPNVTNVPTQAFYNCTSLQSIDLPAVQTIGQEVFDYCPSLRYINAPLVTTIGTSAFRGTSVLVASFPRVTLVSLQLGANRLRNGVMCYDFTDLSRISSSNAFSANKMLVGLVLRNQNVVELTNASALQSTPIAGGCGWIYVPSSLVESYKTAAGWSTYASRIAPISSYPKPLGSITDSWSDIMSAELNGTYSTRYNIGDTKEVYIDGKPYLMQIVAFDADELSDGMGNAKITWLGSCAFDNIAMHTMNTSSTDWGNCQFRNTLNTDILSKIESDVANNIKQVRKTYFGVGSGNTPYTTKTTDDYLWVPSTRELNVGSEDSGVIYSSVFTNNASRVRGGVGVYNSTAEIYITRSRVNGSAAFLRVTTSGSTNSNDIVRNVNAIIGFCT